MPNRILTILYCIAFAVGLVGCDANRAIQSDIVQSASDQTQTVKNLDLKDFEPSYRLRKKAKQYAKRSEKDASEKSTRKRVEVTYGKKEGPTLAFESQHEFKAYQQVKERISEYEDQSLRIHESLKKYNKYSFASKGELHTLNHKQQVVINDTLYRLRGKRQIEIPLDSGEKEVKMLSEMRPAPPQFEYASLPQFELPNPFRSHGTKSKSSELGQCVEIIGWRDEDNKKFRGTPCYVSNQQTRYYSSPIDLPDGALSYDGDPIESILLRPLNNVSSGSSGFLGQTDRLASAFSKVYLYGEDKRYELGVDGLDPDKLTGDVFVDIRLKVAEESCTFGYCYCTDSNIVSDNRSIIARANLPQFYTLQTVNTTGEGIGDYALSNVVDNRCGGKGVTSWHGIEVDGRQYPVYYDGRLFSRFPDSGFYGQNENTDVIYKIRGGCGKNDQNCGARPGERL